MASAPQRSRSDVLSSAKVTLVFSLMLSSVAAAFPFQSTPARSETNYGVCSISFEEPDGEETGICQESDQNVLFQGKLHVVKMEDAGPFDSFDESGLIPTPVRHTNPFEKSGIDESGLIPTPVRHTPKHAEKIPLPKETPLEEFAMAPGLALKRISDNLGPPRAWFLLPFMGTFFIIIMQCTDVHADSYGMEEEEKDDDTLPPPPAERLPLFDIARFGLLVGVIWIQLLVSFGDNIVTSTLQKFVWPAWFLLTGIFGSNFTYESLSRTVCYSIATNMFLVLVSIVFTFFNYHSESASASDYFGGAWVLWLILLYRLTLTPLFQLGRSLRIPGVLLLALIHFGSYVWKLLTPVADNLHTHPKQIEDLLLMVKSTDAVLYSIVLYAPYFATGLLMSPVHWNTLLMSAWFRCIAAVSGMFWFVLTTGPILCSVFQWQCPLRPWGILFVIHADHMSGYWEDVAWYCMRTSAVLITLCMLFASAAVLSQLTPKLAAHLEGCGSRTRYTLAVVVLWYMIRPCVLSPPHLPFQRARGMNDLAIVCPALLIALVLTNSGTQKLFRWIIEPYWVKCWLEGCVQSWIDITPDAKSTSHILQALSQGSPVLLRPPSRSDSCDPYPIPVFT